MFSSFASSSYKIDSNYRYKDIIKENYMTFWTIYEGESKKSNQKVSIFKFDKKKFESYVKDKESRKLTYKKIEEGITSLQKIKHPNFLNIIEPIEVHSSSFIFVSEYIMDNLRGKYGKKTTSNMNSENMTKNSVIFKKGVYELSKALDFMHNVMKKVMVSLNPDNVFIDFKGNWKIGSLFNISSINDSYYELDFFGDYEYGFNISYFAPEVVFSSKFYYQSDYFSLGLIVYFLAYGDDYFKIERNSVEYYKNDFKAFENKTLKIGYKNLFPLLVVNDTDYFFIRLVNTVLNRDISMRSESLLEWMTQEFNSDNGSGDNQLIKTLLFIEKGDFHSIAPERQLVFLNGLTNIWSQFNKSIVISQIVPLLTEILNMKLSMKSMENTNSQMVVVAFNLILDIGKDMLNQKEFIYHVYDQLIFEKLVLYEPIFGLLLQRIDVFQKGLNDDMFVDLLNNKLLKYFGKKYIVINADQVNIQAIVLERTFVECLISCPLFELSTCYTDSILLKLFSQTQSLKIKLLCLDVIKQFVELDKITVYQMNEKVLKLLENNKSDNAKVVMSIMEVLKTLTLSDDFYKNNKSILMERILPLLWKSSMSKNLTLNDYKCFQNVLNYVSRQIQELHIRDLKKDGPQNDTSNSVKSDFKDVVKTVDMNQSTNWIAMKEKEQLEKLNKASVIMKPKDEKTKKDDIDKSVLMSTKKQTSKITYDNAMGILQPKVKH